MLLLDLGDLNAWIIEIRITKSDISNHTHTQISSFFIASTYYKGNFKRPHNGSVWNGNAYRLLNFLYAEPARNLNGITNSFETHITYPITKPYVPYHVLQSSQPKMQNVLDRAIKCWIFIVIVNIEIKFFLFLKYVYISFITKQRNISLLCVEV